MRYALLDKLGHLLKHEHFDEKPADPAGKGWRWVEDPEPPPPPEVPGRRRVEKLLLIDRLLAVGLFDKAMQVLGGPGSVAYERWSAAQFVYADDQDVLALLRAIGGEPETLLAPEAA